MDTLTELLRAHPDCRVTICSSKPRRRAREGDVKMVRGNRYVRRQVYCKHDRAYLVRRGRPVFEWDKGGRVMPTDSDEPPPCHDVPRTLRTIADVAARQSASSAVVIMREGDGTVVVFGIGADMDDFVKFGDLISAGFKHASGMAVVEGEEDDT